MVDYSNTGAKDETNGEHIMRIVDKTQGMIRTRMLSFLGSSSEIINGISNKLESALSMSDTSYTDTGGTQQLTTPSTNTDSEYGAALPSVNRKLNALPSFGQTYEDYEALTKHRQRHRRKRKSGEIAAEGAASSEEASAATLDNANFENEEDKDSLRCEGSTRLSLSQSIDSNLEASLVATGPDPYDKLRIHAEFPSSGSASELDGYGPSTSIESSERKFWIRSGSEGSVQSWASSLSLDSQSDEATVEFMRAFVVQLFKECNSIHLDQKAKFGQLCQQETGRLWFSRFVNAQRGRSKQVNECTFYSLIQFFAIVLFECADSDDFSPAKSLMNMCFTFYHEVDVPGCVPYKEYLYTYLRDQPIWHTLRFWNAAFFDALQCERVHKPIATRDDVVSNNMEAFIDDKRYQENITFGQLGTFTNNMHAFGLSRELCTEFLRKQCTIANLSKDQDKMLKDNVDRMYKETDPWRA